MSRKTHILGKLSQLTDLLANAVAFELLGERLFVYIVGTLGWIIKG